MVTPFRATYSLSASLQQNHRVWDSTQARKPLEAISRHGVVWINTPNLFKIPRSRNGQLQCEAQRGLAISSRAVVRATGKNPWWSESLYVSACPRSLPIEMVFNAEKDNAAERRLSFAASRQQEIGTVQQIACTPAVRPAALFELKVQRADWLLG